MLILNIFTIQIFFLMITKADIVAFSGLINAMIGAMILVLPPLGLQTGYIIIPFVNMLVGLVSYYTCYLLLMHLGDSTSLKTLVLEHFNNKFSALLIYNMLGCFTFINILIIYFKLIIKQIEGFVPQSQWIAPCLFLILFVMTILTRYLRFGERLLATGMLSTITFIIFLIWAFLTAESGPKKLDPIGTKYVDLGATLMMSYGIHGCFIQVLLKTTTHDKFKKILTTVYIAALLIYTLASYSGYTIINRQPRTPNPESISQYFQPHGWEVQIIQLIFLYQMLTVSPEFCIIIKELLYQLINRDDKQLEEEEKEKSITVPEIVIYLGVFTICYIMQKSKVNNEQIITLNGSVVLFFRNLVLPIANHIKCVYFSEHDQNGTLLYKIQHQNGSVEFKESKCKCRIVYMNKLTRVLELIFQAFVIFFGAYVMYYTIQKTFKGTSKQLSTNSVQ